VSVLVKINQSQRQTQQLVSADAARMVLNDYGMFYLQLVDKTTRGRYTQAKQKKPFSITKDLI